MIGWKDGISVVIAFTHATMTFIQTSVERAFSEHAQNLIIVVKRNIATCRILWIAKCPYELPILERASLICNQCIPEALYLITAYRKTKPNRADTTVRSPHERNVAFEWWSHIIVNPADFIIRNTLYRIIKTKNTACKYYSIAFINTRPKMNKPKKRKENAKYDQKKLQDLYKLKKFIPYFFRSLIMTFGDIFLLFNSSSS